MGTLVSEVGTTNQAAADPAVVLFGSTRRRVLGWLLGHPDEAFYLREIVRHTGTSVGALQRELALLTAAGLVSRTVQGRQVYFRANRDSPIFPELNGLFAKTSGLVAQLQRALAPLSDRVRVAFVFGSAARGELRAASDVDLLVVGDVAFQDLVVALVDVQVQLGREVNPTVYSRAEFRRKLTEHHHFLTALMKEPRLFVVGGDDELAGLGAKRLGHEPSDQPYRDPRSAAGRGARPRRQQR
jgi:predicted nucleotidyltransferase